ncbi:MAG: DNA polymerase III subunit delta [Defluviitaleaceae bacterium]|nr:DNA polymerase III subunit delta [Defluviitaleaceae bacterium]
MKELNNRLKSGEINKCYIFCGVEKYLIKSYEKRLLDAMYADELASDMNTAEFIKDFSFADIKNAAEAVSFTADKKLLIFRNTGLLQTGKKDLSDDLAGYIETTHDNGNAVFLFIESEKMPDKRVKLYKTITAPTRGLAVDFTTPPEAELVVWLARTLMAEGVNLQSGAGRFMLQYVCGSAVTDADAGIMHTLHTETLKLAAYVGAGGTADTTDVQAVCTECFDGKVFGLVKELGTKNGSAIVTLSNLLAQKEAPLMLLSMIARQFRLLLICKGLRDKGHPPTAIATATKLRDFMVRDYLTQSGSFSHKELADILTDVLQAETNIKNGKMEDRLALELLVIGNR